MKSIAVCFLIFFAGQASAEIYQYGSYGYQCQATGGFFDFAPDGAIADCRKEIDVFCKSKSAPPLIKTVNGYPSGLAKYAKAEIVFECGTEADVAARKKAVVDEQNRQARIEIENSKKMCQQDFGFSPNTPEFSTCLLELQKQIFANKRQAQEIAAQKELALAQLLMQRQAETDKAAIGALESINKVTTPATPRPAVTTNCTTYGSTLSCTSR